MGHEGREGEPASIRAAVVAIAPAPHQPTDEIRVLKPRWLRCFACLTFQRCSRPPIPEETKKEIERLYRSKRYSINQISKRLGIAYGTAWNYVRKLPS